MRSITPILTPELERHLGGDPPAKAAAFPLSTYRELIEQTARLAYLNKDYLLFFRGQAKDYANRAGASSFYPSLYREDKLRREEVELRFRRLESASQELRRLASTGKIEGHADLSRKRYVQWSILQHYEVVDTPLLDLTHSQRVACSFAMRPKGPKLVFVYVFGMPYVTHRISYNSEQDTVLIRLLSICPPSALRPYFQDGYLAGTADVTSDYESKYELDLANRLIAKFSIPNKAAFWGRGLRGLSQAELYPEDDSMKALCGAIKKSEALRADGGGTEHRALGEFVAAWAGLEQALMRAAQHRTERILSVPHAIRALRGSFALEPADVGELDHLRRVRNAVVHGNEFRQDNELRDLARSAARLRDRILEGDRDSERNHRATYGTVGSK